MKAKQIELDVDIIGGNSSLTKEEEVALSIFFKKRKINSKAIASTPKSKTTKRSKLQLK